MNTISKTMMCLVAMLVALPLCAQTKYEHKCFTAIFPDKSEVIEQQKDGLDILTYMDSTCAMQVVVFPVSLEPERIILIGSEVNAEISSAATIRETVIGGYKLKSVDADANWRFSEYLQGRVYIMSNGEVTVAMSEYLKDSSEPKWWENHITWNVPEKSDKSLAERLEQLKNFMNSEMMRVNCFLNFTDTGNTLELNAHFIDGRKPKDIGYDRMKKAMQMSFAVFSVFREYADKQYDIYVKLIEDNGESTKGFEFPWSEYSTWPDITTVFEDDTSEVTIDDDLQRGVYSVLCQGLDELEATKGMVVVMETQTGLIKALSAVERTDSIGYKGIDPNEFSGENGMFSFVTFLGAMNRGSIAPSDSVDTGCGICEIGGRALKDHNWHRGGYGKITYEEAMLNRSNISCYKAFETAFNADADALCAYQETLGWDAVASVCDVDSVCFAKTGATTDGVWQSIGYQLKLHPLHMLALINAIANDGTMVCPTMRDKPTIINEQVASDNTIDNFKQMMRKRMAKYNRRYTKTDITSAGYWASTQLEDQAYRMDFCAYFPDDNPQYTIYCVCEKQNLPAAAVMPTDIYMRIVELLTK